MAKRLRDTGAALEVDEEGAVEPDEVLDSLPDDGPSRPKSKGRSTAPMVDIAAPEFESSRLHNGQLEFVTLVRVVLDENLQARLWPRLSLEHFASETTREIYQRLQTLQHAGRDWPKLATLSMEPALSLAAKAQLRTVLSRADKGKPLTHGTLKLANDFEVPLETQEDFEVHVYNLLDSYRITRMAAEHFVGTITKLADEEVFDPFQGPSIVEAAAAEVLAIRGQESISDVLLHFGYLTTEEDALKREAELQAMMSSDKLSWKTGWTKFDEEAGGFQPGEVVLLGANSGGGKTAAALTLMENMAPMGTSCAMLQLELSMGQMDERISAGLAGINSKVIRAGNLPSKLKKKIKQSWQEFHEDCVAARSRFTVWAPSEATVQAAEMVFKQHDYKVWFIDYVNLLRWEGKEGGWEKLAEITKEFKRLAKKYQITIVLCVQVNVDKDTGEIEVRYAKAMKENADIALVWFLTKEAREKGHVWFRHIKARQYEPFDFPMRIALEHYRFENFSEEDQPKKRRLGKSRVVQKDDMDQAVEKSTFRKKKKPLMLTDGEEQPVPVGIALADDLDLVGEPVRVLSLDEDEDYSEFDEE